MNTAVGWILLIILALPSLGQNKAGPPKPPLPVAKPAPQAVPAPKTEDAAKRRERMKQRDAEIDRMLKQQKKKQAEQR